MGEFEPGGRTKTRLPVSCRRCGGEVEWSLLCNALFFHCEAGHYLSVKDMLGEKCPASEGA